MKKMPLIFVLYILLFSLSEGSSVRTTKSDVNLDSLFNTRHKGEIVYYDGNSLESSDYLNSLEIKEKLIESGNDVYSITIADVLGNKSNQYIAVVENELSKEKKIIIYSAEKVLFEYTVKNYNKDVKVAVDLESFKNKNKNVSVVKLYVMNEYENKKTVDLHMFISYNNKISLLSDIMFYNEVKSLNPYVSKIDIVFEDIDGDGALEMLVSSSQKIADKEEKIEYITYKFDYKINNYVCVGSSWYGEDYSVYFN